MTDVRADAGWQADPSGRHEARYFVGGQPTDLVRDGEQQGVDPLDWTTTSPPPPPPTTGPPEFGEDLVDVERIEADARHRSKAYLVAIGIALVVLAMAGASAVFLLSRGENKVTEIVSPPSPSEKAADLATTLRSALCSTSTSASSCSVTSGDGVIEVYISKYAVDEDRLVTAGEKSGLWNAADVARMTRTRALDGTQRTPDGMVSWTYHPDNGFQLVADVS